MSRLELNAISKQYPGVRANDAVSLRVEPGEIHALLGENGAGKSTLMKIIYGAVQADSGSILWNGRSVRITSPAAARKLGIAMVYQHFALFESMTVAENVWLGLNTELKLSQVSDEIRRVAERYGLEVAPERPVHGLSVGEKQRVEIVRALLGAPELLILDEPTSVLAPAAVQKLFKVLRQLADAGCSILYISHKLDEVRELCHACTVLRAGRVTGTVRPAEVTNEDLCRLMIGSALPQRALREAEPTETVLELRALSIPAKEEFGVALSAINLRVRAGEIVGVAGVSGNGQRELLAALSGEDAHVPRGAVMYRGIDMAGVSASKRRALGLRFAPEDRVGRAVLPGATLEDNALLTRADVVPRSGLINRQRLRSLAKRLIGTFGVKAGGPRALASSLSGGNLQKFIISREVDAAPRLLIVAQPTWGVDVGAASHIRSELVRLRDQGVAVLVVSEELSELFEVSDAICVMAGGRLSPPLPRARATVERIGAWMSGLFGPESPKQGRDLEPHHA